MMLENLQEAKASNFTHIGDGSNIHGEFSFQGTVFISGEVRGKILAQKESWLIITPTGKVEADIECEKIDVYGFFDGNLVSEGKTTLHSSAKFKGKILTKDLVIHAGAHTNFAAHTKD